MGAEGSCTRSPLQTRPRGPEMTKIQAQGEVGFPQWRLSTMKHYLVCDNAQCRFVLDVRINGTRTGHAQFFPNTCPQCSGKWSSQRPLPFRALRVGERDKLPYCSCCRRKKHRVAA